MQRIIRGDATRRLGIGCVIVATVLAVGCKPNKTEKITSIYELKAEPTEQNLSAIRGMLKDPDRDVRATALSALVTVGVSDGQALARAGLGDADGFVRATAAKLLGDLGNASDAALLVERLAQDRDPVVRRRSAESLASIGGESAVIGLVQGLSDPIEEVRLAAVRGVRELDPARATADLARLVLEDPMYEIRVQAARALGTTGDPEVLPVLKNALEDPNEFVRAAAANALRVHKSVRERDAAEAAVGQPSLPVSRDR